MRPIRTERLIIRDWEERDRDLFFRINSEDAVMRFFPFRRDRAQSDAFFDTIRAENARSGIGFSALELAGTGQSIGFVGLAADGDVPGLPPETVEIGWRLAPEHWGKGYVTEACRALLAYGFEELGLEEIVSFAVWDNRRSTAVMERLGMRRDPAHDFDHPKIPDSHPHLKRHVFYRLARTDWRGRQKGG